MIQETLRGLIEVVIFLDSWVLQKTRYWNTYPRVLIISGILLGIGSMNGVQILLVGVLSEGIVQEMGKENLLSSEEVLWVLIVSILGVLILTSGFFIGVEIGEDLIRYLDLT